MFVVGVPILGITYFFAFHEMIVMYDCIILACLCFIAEYIIDYNNEGRHKEIIYLCNMNWLTIKIKLNNMEVKAIITSLVTMDCIMMMLYIINLTTILDQSWAIMISLIYLLPYLILFKMFTDILREKMRLCARTPLLIKVLCNIIVMLGFLYGVLNYNVTIIFFASLIALHMNLYTNNQYIFKAQWG